MNLSRKKQGYFAVPTLSIFAGLLSWLLVVVLVGDIDPMQHKQYLVIAYPLLLLTSIYLGWIYGTKAWHCGFWMLGTQFLVGLITIKSDLNMLPLGLFIFAILAAIVSFVALISGVFSKKIKG